MWIGDFIIYELGPFLKALGNYMPGEFFPSYFLLEYFHRPLLASFIVAIALAFATISAEMSEVSSTTESISERIDFR